MLGVDYRLVVANDGIDVLEENNPGHHRMGKACFGRFLVVLAEIARRVKKLSRNDRRFQSDFVGSIKNCLATGLGRTTVRSEEHTSELQSRGHLVCRLLL